EEDGTYTDEDTLKLMEYTSNCLKNEMSQYPYASWTTFRRRRIFAVQSIGNKLTLLSTSRMEVGKWCFVEIRSAIVPRDWEDRLYLNHLMELLMKLKVRLQSSYKLTMLLIQQESGVSPVDAEDTIKAVNRSGQAIKELY
ncbi:hypothetical protein BDB00DRAFT_767810, partial [Zychaea mexicana]|uniref:uncharacterized protein n=1 Tax=Zychaea mexicana TaxID=64656 RepID=UPI0022FEE686